MSTNVPLVVFHDKLRRNIGVILSPWTKVQAAATTGGKNHILYYYKTGNRSTYKKQSVNGMVNIVHVRKKDLHMSS